MFEREFLPLYCPDNWRPAKPIRLMVGLLILKHVRDLSDGSVVERRISPFPRIINWQRKLSSVAGR